MLDPIRIRRLLGLAVVAAVIVAPLVVTTGAGADSAPRVSTRAFVWHSYAMQIGERHATRPDAVTIAGPYTTWDWPSPGYFANTSEDMTIGARTTPGAQLFFSNQFASESGPPNGDGGGYFGLQEGSSSNGQKIAIFSIWGATAMKGADCNVFDNEGTGRSCRLAPYNWVTGRTYHLAVTQASVTARGTWWKATVTDSVTGATGTIGQLRIPTAWGQLQHWVSWTEFFGDTGSLTKCAQLPHSDVVFRYPQADDGTEQIVGHENIVHDAQCRARITNQPGGVRQVLPF